MSVPLVSSPNGEPHDHSLSEEELALIRAIGAEEVKGLPVTYRQLQVLTGHKSNYSVQVLAKRLAVRGYVALNPRSARAIRLTRSGFSVATQGVGAIHALPIRGVRRSFYATWAEAGSIRFFPISSDAFSPRADYLIVAAGRAKFPERGLFDGDLVAVRQTASAQHQHLFVEEFEGRFRVGKALPKSNGWKLVGSEDLWESLHPRIVGDVVGVLRTRVTWRQGVRAALTSDSGADLPHSGGTSVQDLE